VPVKATCTPARTCCASSFHRPSRPLPRRRRPAIHSGCPRPKTADKTYIRKPAYEYGWDWGPRFVTSGIWKPVRIEAWDKVRIADFAIRQRDVSREVAHLDAEVEIEAASAGPAKVSVQYSDQGKPVTVMATVSFMPGATSSICPSKFASRSSGSGRLWRAAALRVHRGGGYGRQPAEERKVKAGLRSIVLHRELDKWGRSFEFVVNGIPVFAKGADVIPFDSFPNRVTTANYRRILQSARDANMNMIRHWGGGYYESDEFYAICDELGIMVWQDFMFGNDWQPGTYAFKQNIEAEAEDQVRRLRNHPSIVIWCGNNETEEASTGAERASLPADVKF
jgi:beta-mannosidase